MRHPMQLLTDPIFLTFAGLFAMLVVAIGR
jgi:hypothetical protein